MIMIVQFQLVYKTHMGQELMLLGSIPELGNGRQKDALPMRLDKVLDGLWIAEVEVNWRTAFSYRYFVKDTNFDTIIEEWGPDRNCKTESIQRTKVVLSDCWRPMSDPDFALNSSAFINAIVKPTQIHNATKVKAGKPEETVILRFKPNVVRIKPEHQVAVCGSAKAMGLWNEKKAVMLGNQEYPTWYGEVSVKVSEFPVYFKYLIKNEKGQLEFWENTTDRIITLPEGDVPDVIEIGDQKFEFPQHAWKGAGIAIPVFSLRRRQGFGVGEFTDLKLLVDWASDVGFRLIQILPVNDTVATHTWMDSYPYAAISVYALHPLYINLLEIGELNSSINQQIIEAQGNYLNSQAKIDYEAVMALKSRFFKLIYDQKKQEFLHDPEFKAFFEANSHWLMPYAAFSYLRDLFNTPDFSRWGEYSKPTAELLAHITDPHAAHYDDIAVHYFIQYHAHLQLVKSAEYARSRGVVLKGDIPIGIYRNSADAWLYPHLYHMDSQAGAPPDDFSSKGQNWRFPTYNWHEMAKDNYAWWQQRLQQLSHYFDAFRIDHILGFFRIWEIPSLHTEGLMGYFNPSLPYYREEIQNRGIWFDEKRLCKPYIREHFLYERFGDLTDFVKANYLVESGYQCYELHPDYDTQHKVEERLRIEPDASPAWRSRIERITQGLFSLIAEVIFIPAPGTGGNAFYPRHSLHFTRSYMEIDNHTKHLINELYLDYFYHRNEEFWKGKAMEKLPVLKKATNMLLCGEDLGMVPACVPSVMNELGILSLEVQRMPKDPKVRFGHPSAYPYMSVATPSSHDTSTIRGWWEENFAQSQQFYTEILGNTGEAPYFCEAWVVKQIISQHLYSPSMWSIFAIQDILGMDAKIRLQNAGAERINNPGNPNHYWRYRMHINLEDLMDQTDFNTEIRELLIASGRSEIY